MNSCRTIGTYFGGGTGNTIIKFHNLIIFKPILLSKSINHKKLDKDFGSILANF